MSKLFCITDMIRFLMKEAEKLMKWSVHGDNFFILYDASFLMKIEGDDHMDEIEQPCIDRRVEHLILGAL